MSGYSSERCTECGNLTSPELLTIKRVAFFARTQSSKTIKSRTTGWLCEKCRDKDPDWNREAYTAPGHTSEPLERVRRFGGAK